MTKRWKRAWTIVAPGLLIGIGAGFGAPQPRGETDLTATVAARILLECQKCSDIGGDPQTAQHQFTGSGAFMQCGPLPLNPCHSEESEDVQQ